jgi:hypothetical protein
MEETLNNVENDDYVDYDDDTMMQDAIEGGGDEPIIASVNTRKIKELAKWNIYEDKETDDDEEEEALYSSQRKRPRVSNIVQENKGSLIDTRKSAERVEFTQDGDEDVDEDNITENSQLFEKKTINRSKYQSMEIPKAKQFRSTLKDKSPAPKPGSTYGRTSWTFDEEQAFICGINRYGVGKWSLILEDDEFREILHRRTNINLKDKHRNMGRKGLL